MVPHMVPMSLRQIKNRIPLDLPRLQATNESCHVGSEHCWVLQRGARYGLAWPRSLRAYAFPRIGAVPASDMTTADALAVLTPIWHDKPETARRARQRIGAVTKWAVAMRHVIEVENVIRPGRTRKCRCRHVHGDEIRVLDRPS